jgi:hypothetical protein
VILSGLVCTSDWIASAEEFFPPSGLPDDSNFEKIAREAVLSGKTEAALFAAYKLIAEGENNGIYFGLPTRLTSDRIHSRVQAN